MKIKKIIYAAAIVALFGCNVSYAHTAKNIITNPMGNDIYGKDCTLLNLEPTTELHYQLNFDSREPANTRLFNMDDSSTYDITLDSDIVVNNIESPKHELRTYYINNGGNHWSVRVYVDNKEVAAGSLLFSTTGELINTMNLDDVRWDNYHVKINFTGSTAHAAPLDIKMMQMDGMLVYTCEGELKKK